MDKQKKIIKPKIIESKIEYKICVDCGKSDDTVRFRESGYGIQCYSCYKSDMIADEECR